jgi:hypothetical protein
MKTLRMVMVTLNFYFMNLCCCILIKTNINQILDPVCLQESEFLWESKFRGKWIPKKYFPMFGSVMENELENNLLMN